MTRAEILLNPEIQINKFLPIILELLISEYGEQHRELIISRSKRIHFELSSTPTELNKFLKSLKLSGKIKYNTNLFSRILYTQQENIERKKSLNIMMGQMKHYANYFLKVSFDNVNSSKLENEMKENDPTYSISKLFSDELFNEGYVDAFSEDSIKDLNDINTPDFIKESIRKDQERVLATFRRINPNIETISSNIIDAFIGVRKRAKDSHEDSVVKNKYGTTIVKKLNSAVGWSLSTDAYAKIINSDSGLHYGIPSLFSEKMISIIRLPVLKLINQKRKTLDIIIIHEIIHAIEYSGKRSGLSIDKKPILNEIRVQKLAISIVKKMHYLGCFIYDDRKFYHDMGESMYEDLFNLVGDFYEINQNFNEEAITGTFETLTKKFGTSNTYGFIEILEKTFAKIMRYRNKYRAKFEDIPFDIEQKEIENIILQMNIYNNENHKKI